MNCSSTHKLSMSIIITFIGEIKYRVAYDLKFV